MLHAITTPNQPATDRGYLLAKHPVPRQSFTLSYGQTHVFYPEVAREPLYRVRDCVFGVLALKSEPVDPRL